jgi:hypothetical protein
MKHLLSVIHLRKLLLIVVFDSMEFTWCRITFCFAFLARQDLLVIIVLRESPEVECFVVVPLEGANEDVGLLMAFILDGVEYLDQRWFYLRLIFLIFRRVF